MDIGDGGVRDPLLFVARIEDGRTIAGSPVVTLTIQRGRVMNLEEKLQKPPVTDRLRIKDNLNRFGMISVVLISGVRYVAACISDTCGNHARVSAQQILHAPEAAAGKNRTFGRCGHVFTPSPESRNSWG